MNKSKGCWLCKHLAYFEADYESSDSEGFYCEFKETEHFKTFPCNRKLKCQEVSNE